MGRKLNTLEANLSEKVDPIASNVAKSFGYSEDQFPDFLYRAMICEVIFYQVFTLLATILRPDFLNLTLGTVAIL